jgi:hypothetical protein
VQWPGESSSAGPGYFCLKRVDPVYCGMPANPSEQRSSSSGGTCRDEENKESLTEDTGRSGSEQLSEGEDLSALSLCGACYTGSSEFDPVINRRQALAVLAGIAVAGTFSYGQEPASQKHSKQKITQNPDPAAKDYRRPGMTKEVVVSSRENYPYSESTLVISAGKEKQMFPQHTLIGTAIIIASNIADRVAWQCHEAVRDEMAKKDKAAAQRLTVEDSLKIIGASEGNLKFYVDLLAKELVRAGGVYRKESSLHRAMDPGSGGSEHFYLDCDLLCHFALHAAARHDLPLHIELGGWHAYLSSPKFPDLVVEMTEFEGRMPGASSSQAGAGGSFFSSRETQRRRVWTSSPEVEKLFGLFTQLSEKQIEETAAGTLLAMKAKDTCAERSLDEIERVCALADKELESCEGNYIVADNTYTIHSFARDLYLARWFGSKGTDFEARRRGMAHAARIAEIKKDPIGQYLSVIYSGMDNGRMQELSSGTYAENTGEKLVRLRRQRI